MSDLVKKQDPLLSRVEVSVLSKANPVPGLLRVARIILQRTASLREMFALARSEAWTSDRLSEALFLALTPFFLEGAASEDPNSLREVCTYLADEHLQIGDSVLLISNETGRAIARLTDKDFYQPTKVPREDGSLATPGVRIRPEIEAFVTQWQFDRGHEEDIRQGMLAKLPTTSLLRETGDRRVLYATRQGRKVLVSEIGAKLPEIIPGYCKGATRTLFEYIQVTKDSPKDSGLVFLGEVRNHAQASYPLQDKKSKNLRHDVWMSILSTTASGWGRALAGHIVSGARDFESQSLALSDLRDETLSGFWICSPNVAISIARLNPNAEVLPIGISDEWFVGLMEPCGYLRIHEDSYAALDREVFDRWEVSTTFTASLWVDPTKIRVLRVEGISVTGVSSELV